MTMASTSPALMTIRSAGRASPGLVRVQGRLDGQPALGRPQRGGCQRLVAGRPHGDNGVAGEADHVAAMLIDQVDDRGEGRFEQRRQLLHAQRPALGQALGKRREADDIDKHDAGGEGLRGRRGDQPGIIRDPANDERGHKAQDALEKRSHDLSSNVYAGGGEPGAGDILPSPLQRVSCH
jgi:hypothetical protein